MNSDEARRLLVNWIKKTVRDYKLSGHEYTHGKVWEKVRKRATKLAEWEDVKNTLGGDAFDRLGLSLSKQIGRVRRIVKRLEVDQQMEFIGEGFDCMHSYVIGWTDEGEGRLRVGWAMTGDEGDKAEEILIKNISADHASLKKLQDERTRLPGWRGDVTWKQAAITAENVNA